MNKISDQVIEILMWGTIAVMAVGALGVMAFQAEAIQFLYPLDYGEAPLINQAMQLTNGNRIYRDSIDQPPYTIANYPPVYVLLLAIFEVLVGPAFWYGRLISSLSALGSATIIIMMVYSRSRNLLLSAIPGLLFINLPFVASWSALARIDHLALFFALAGLYFLFQTDNSDDRLVSPKLLTGSIFLVLAIYTRQSYALAAPMAGFLFFIHRKWRQGVVLAGLVGGLSLIIFFVINILSSGGFYFNIVTANINPFGFERMVNNFRNFFESSPVIFILTPLCLILSIKHINGWPMLVGFVFGGFFSALTIGKIGSNVNYFLEFAAGMSLIIGFGMTVLFRKRAHPVMRGLIIVFTMLISWQGIRMIRFVQQESRVLLDNRLEAFEEIELLATMVRQHNDRPILADEYMGLILLSGQDLYLQPFEVTQLSNASLFDQNKLINQIDNETFSLILLQEGSWWSYVVQERWTSEMLDAIRLNYRMIAQLEETNVYKPMTRQPSDVITDCPLGIWPLPTSVHLGYQFQDGMLSFYGAGTEEQVPVVSPVNGKVYRPEHLPEGTLLIVFDDPVNTGMRSVLLFEHMRSYRGDRDLIVEVFPHGVGGIPVKAGEVIGYQSMWSGRPLQQYWLHVKLGIASFEEAYLSDYELLKNNLVDPSDFFGIKIESQTTGPRPVECQ